MQFNPNATATAAGSLSPAARFGFLKLIYIIRQHQKYKTSGLARADDTVAGAGARGAGAFPPPPSPSGRLGAAARQRRHRRPDAATDRPGGPSVGRSRSGGCGSRPRRRRPRSLAHDRAGGPKIGGARN